MDAHITSQMQRTLKTQRDKTKIKEGVKKMKTFTRGKAKTASVSDLYGQYITDAISKIREQAFENYERLNGPAMMTKTTDAQLGIDGMVKDLMVVCKKYQEA
jgi:hypothetical protein